MIVTCENCKSRFNLSEDLVKESGSKVRCSKCQHIFVVYKDSVAEEVSPPHEDKITAPPEELAEQPAAAAEGLASAEKGGVEVSEEFPEEPLDFDLFDSEDEEEEEEFSLEDFGLEEELGEAQASPQQTSAEERVISEEEITAADLGFEEESPTEEVPEPTGELTAQEEQEPVEGAQEDLSLEEKAVSDEAVPSTQQATDAERVESEEGISFEDLALEEEPVSEEVTELGQQVAEEADVEEGLSFEDFSLEEEAVVEEGGAPAERMAERGEAGSDDEFSVEDFSLDEAAVEEGFPEERGAMEVEAEAPEQAGLQSSEGVAVASVEEGEEVEEGRPGEEPLPPPMEGIPPPERRGVSTPLLVALVVVLVGAGAVAAYTFLKNRDIKISFVESLIGASKSETVDPGNRRINLLEDVIAGEFFDHRSLGRLFVIKGKIRSNYADERNFIKMKGVLYLKNGKVARERVVYCGNILSDTELQTLDFDTINRKLDNRFGDNKVNFRVPVGKELPFMIVFSDIPEQLGEFSVEVVGSVAA